MKTVSYQTPRGTEISIEIVTERPAVADHTRIEDAWAIEYRLNGKPTHGKRVEDPEHGPAIQLELGVQDNIAKTATAPIPADKVAEVDALIEEYEAGVAERQDRRFAEYEADEKAAEWRQFIHSDGEAA